MRTFHINGLAESYEEICRYVAENGRRTAPRGQTTYEVPAVTIVLENPWRNLPAGIGRGINPAIAAAEALQLIGGVSHPELMVRITRNFEQFRDGGIYHGAYGPRVRAQLPAVVKRLKEQPDTRQAIVNLWDPQHDLFVPDSRDYPCTIFLQYFVRHGQLEAHTHMRSNDVWWGLPYDVFQFTTLQMTIAHALGIDPGQYVHHAASLHIYERNLADVDRLQPYLYPIADLPYGGLGYPGIMWEHAATLARDILRGWKLEGAPTKSERWFEKTLAPYVADAAT